MPVPEGFVCMTNGEDFYWKYSTDADYLDWFVRMIQQGYVQDESRSQN